MPTGGIGMDQAFYAKREAELRKEYPKMFSHPGVKPGEVCLGEQLCDVVELNVDLYRKAGMPSVRFDETLSVLSPLRGQEVGGGLNSLSGQYS
jgi:hypothetical protein